MTIEISENNYNKDLLEKCIVRFYKYLRTADLPGYNTCTTCRKSKPRKDYYCSRGHTCKECQSAINKAAYLKKVKEDPGYRARLKQTQKEYYEENPDKLKEKNYKHNHTPNGKARRARGSKKWKKEHPEYMLLKRARVSLAPAGLRQSVPQEIVELKALQLTLRQEITKKKGA